MPGDGGRVGGWGPKADASDSWNGGAAPHPASRDPQEFDSETKYGSKRGICGGRRGRVRGFMAEEERRPPEQHCEGAGVGGARRAVLAGRTAWARNGRLNAQIARGFVQAARCPDASGWPGGTRTTKPIARRREVLRADRSRGLDELEIAGVACSSARATVQELHIGPDHGQSSVAFGGGSRAVGFMALRVRDLCFSQGGRAGPVAGRRCATWRSPLALAGTMADRRRSLRRQRLEPARRVEYAGGGGGGGPCSGTAGLARLKWVARFGRYARAVDRPVPVRSSTTCTALHGEGGGDGPDGAPATTSC